MGRPVEIKQNSVSLEIRRRRDRLKIFKGNLAPLFNCGIIFLKPRRIPGLEVIFHKGGNDIAAGENLLQGDILFTGRGKLKSLSNNTGSLFMVSRCNKGPGNDKSLEIINRE